MELTAPAIDKILSLAPIEIFNHHGLVYSSAALNLIAPPVPSGVSVVTLTALVALFGSNFEGLKDRHSVFHVTGETKVEVYSNESNDYAKRQGFASASFSDITAFSFNKWLDTEQFAIGLQAHFLDEGDRGYCLKSSSSVEVGDKLNITDNGRSQEVTAKTGVSLNKDLELKPRVTLTPFRTFREVAQPCSEFVFRISKGNNGAPMFGLFEADGGAWKLEAMKRVAAYLQAAIADDKATVIY